MTLVVEHLALGARDIDGLSMQLAILSYRCTLLCQVEDTRVTTLANLPLHFEHEILELVCKDDVTTFAFTTTIEVQAAILQIPLAGNVILLVTTPAIEALAIEQHVEAILVCGQCTQVNLGIVVDHILHALCISTNSSHQCGGC